MKRKYIYLLTLLAAGTGLATSLILHPELNSRLNWGLVAIGLAILVILAFFFELQSPTFGSKQIAVISLLATLSAVMRVPFAALPNFQPCTFLIICSGYVFGPVPGFMVGAMTPLISNFFLGQGPWTLYQMLTWGLIGCGAALLGRFHLGRNGLIAFGILSGFCFGLLMNIYFWLYFAYPLTLRTLFLAQLGSLWFDLSHAIANAIFLGLFGLRTIAILERYRKRFSWVYSESLGTLPGEM